MKRDVQLAHNQRDDDDAYRAVLFGVHTAWSKNQCVQCTNVHTT